MKQINSSDRFDAYAESRIGGREENQDRCGYQDTPFGYLVVVCDGMGGGPSGALASQIAVEAIVGYVLDAKPDMNRCDVLMLAIKHANRQIIEQVSKEPSLAGMGTTVAALLINDYSAVVAYVGDSRIYQLRHGKKMFRSFDHSKVFELVKSGVLTEEQARISGDSNIITRALGQPEVEVDVEELAYERGDRFMLCTDGVWGAMPEKELLNTTRLQSAAGVVESLAISADEKGSNAGGHHDNLTLAIVETKSNSKLKQPMSTRTKYLVYILTAVCVISIICNIVLWRSHSRAEVSVPEAPEASAVVDSDAVNKMISDALKKQDDEYNRRQEQRDSVYSKELENIKKLITENPDKAKEVISSREGQMTLVSQLNELNNTLERLRDMKSGKEKDTVLKKVQSRFDKMSSVLKESGVSETDIKTIDEWLKNDIAKRDISVDEKSKGHYNLIIKKVNEIKEQLRNEDNINRKK